MVCVQALDEDQEGTKVVYKKLFEEDREYNQGKVAVATYLLVLCTAYIAYHVLHKQAPACDMDINTCVYCDVIHSHLLTPSFGQ